MGIYRVYIGGTPRDTEERDLERFFRSYGRIRNILIKKGMAFVDLDNSRDAEDAIYELNGKQLLGTRVTVEAARRKIRGRDRYPIDRSKYGVPIRTKYRLLVKNLSSRVGWQDLRDHMRKAGVVTFGVISKQCRNEGAVEFASYSDMKAAMRKLDCTELKGRRIHLEVSELSRSRHKRRRSPNSFRSRSGSERSRSISKSRSRTRSRSPTLSSKGTSNDERNSHSRSASVSRSRAVSGESEDQYHGSSSRRFSRSMSKYSNRSLKRSRSRSGSQPAAKRFISGS